MKKLLSAAYDLAVANDGEEGLSLALSTQPDLILTDFNMPKMTGKELLRRLRQEPSLDDVPVIVLTGNEEDQLRVDLLRNGAQDFLVKPFSVEELRRAHRQPSARQAGATAVTRGAAEPRAGHRGAGRGGRRASCGAAGRAGGDADRARRGRAGQSSQDHLSDVGLA
jgi:CheY-like chemotaxis protein